MRISFTKALLAAAFVSVSLSTLQSCKENIDTSARYVFVDETVCSYLHKHEQYSAYCHLLQVVPAGPISSTSVDQLLSARGHFTCFAPTNEAINAFLELQVSKGFATSPTWEGVINDKVRDSLQKVVVYNSIINSGDVQQAYSTTSLPTTDNAEIPLPNMSDRKLIVNNRGDTLFISNCPMDERNCNIECTNGYIHAMHAVVSPSTNTLGARFQAILSDKIEGYYVAAMLAEAVGMIDTLSKRQDETYEYMYQTGAFPETVKKKYWGCIPEHRYYGYTYFA
ncbi:MAG: fasciclin domain-containing protein, partial [Bacteroidaceae bacterium]|nr:fasciclin domain-containing protein [Bacteroidaceae bacterium]